MRSNAYCGNLLWQSSPTLQAPDAGAEAGGVMFDGMQLKDDFGETLKSYPPPKGE